MAESARNLLYSINEHLLNPIIGLMIGLGAVIFLYGVVEFMANPDNQEKKENGKRHMIWGIVGLFIMTAVFGIINVINNFIQGI
ncbi:MAG: hypothetical protein ABIJ28_01555 [Patescibacteria group bacterium]|nr:hypothetical protein [Patescibacteria group bacterium]